MDPLQVLQTSAVAERVVSEVEDVIGFVVGQVHFEHLQLVVDGVDEADPSGQEVEGTDPAMGDAAVALGDVVVDVAGREDGLVEVLELGLVEPSLKAALAAFQFSSYLGVHSKRLFPWSGELWLLSQTSRKTQEFRVFSKLLLADR